MSLPAQTIATRREPSRDAYDAIVVGAGPNGLSAAITLAEAGRSVLLIEAAQTIGGGARSAALTLPGYMHDICSAIHPLGIVSPRFASLPLEDYGLRWIHSPLAAAHPLPNGGAAVASPDLAASASSLGVDADAYRRLFDRFVAHADAIVGQVMNPWSLPRHPFVMARFGLQAIRSARGLASGWFRGELAPGLFAGMAAHSILPLDRPLTAAVGLMFSVTAHAAGWPFPERGSQAIVDALAAHFQSQGGEIVTGCCVTSLAQLPAARAILFDVTPRQLDRIAGEALPKRYRRRLARFRHGPGVFKLDWALDGPIPWQSEACAQAATVHVGGTFEEVAAAEGAAWSDQPAERPFVLVAQQSRFDSTRAPEGKHTGWAYCHVPHGSPFEMTERIEAQIERFAPGFRDRILARHAMGPAQMEQYNENYIGGDITGGVMDLAQLIARPSLRLVPYATPNPTLFLCSASTPPGPGVHGMCGYHAAQAALRRVLRD